MSTRYELVMTLDNYADTASLRYCEIEEAMDALHGFTVRNRLDAGAEAAIYDHRSFRYIAKFKGGVKFGPVDTRPPMVKLYDKAIRSGARVTVIDDFYASLERETPAQAWVRQAAAKLRASEDSYTEAAE